MKKVSRLLSTTYFPLPIVRIMSFSAVIFCCHKTNYVISPFVKLSFRLSFISQSLLYFCSDLSCWLYYKSGTFQIAFIGRTLVQPLLFLSLYFRFFLIPFVMTSSEQRVSCSTVNNVLFIVNTFNQEHIVEQYTFYRMQRFPEALLKGMTFPE